MESSRNKTAAQKRKKNGGESKPLKKNSFPETLAAMGVKKEAAKKEAAATVAKQRASANLAKQAESAKKAVKEQERKAAVKITRATAAAARARVENKKNKAAVAKEKTVRFRSSERSRHLRLWLLLQKEPQSSGLARRRPSVRWSFYRARRAGNATKAQACQDIPRFF